MSIENAPPKLVLASRSPRRQELLREAGYEFEIDPADVDEENYPPGTLPADLALMLARTKAVAVAMRRPDAVILGADTVVAFGDRSMGKPETPEQAIAMLTLLSGTTQIVITGVCVIHRDRDFDQEQRVLSAVRMRSLTPGEIRRYVETGEWHGKAGGYGIQDRDPFVTRMSGCHANIVGLPMPMTKKLLAAAGIHPRPGP